MTTAPTRTNGAWPLAAALLAACLGTAVARPAAADTALRFTTAAGEPLPPPWQDRLAAATRLRRPLDGGVGLPAGARAQLAPGDYAVALAAAPDRPFARIAVAAGATEVNIPLPAGERLVALQLPGPTGGAELQVGHECGRSYRTAAAPEVLLLLPPGPAAATLRWHHADGRERTAEFAFRVADTPCQDLPWPRPADR